MKYRCKIVIVHVHLESYSIFLPPAIIDTCMLLEMFPILFDARHVYWPFTSLSLAMSRTLDILKNASVVIKATFSFR